MKLLKYLIASALLLQVSAFAEEFTFDPGASTEESTESTYTTSTSEPTSTYQAPAPDYTAAVAVLEEKGVEKFPAFYGWAYPIGMSGNAAITTSAPYFILYPNLVQGNQFVMLDPVNNLGMFAFDALGGSLFGYVNANATDPGRIYMGYSGGDNAFGLGVYTTLNTTTSSQTNNTYQVVGTETTKNTTNGETLQLTNELYGVFASFGLPSLTLYGSLEYRYVNYNEQTTSSTVDTTSSEEITSQTQLSALAGMLITSDIHTLDISLNITSATHEYDLVDKSPTLKTETSLIGPNDYLFLNFGANYGAIVKSAKDHNIYLGTTLGLSYLSYSDYMPGESTQGAGANRKDESDLGLEITPNVAVEYILTKNIILFGSAHHVISRTSNTGSTVIDLDPLPTSENYQIAQTSESSSLDNSSTTAFMGVRWEYRGISVESVLGNNLFVDGTSALFNTGLGLASTTVTFAF